MCAGICQGKYLCFFLPPLIGNLVNLEGVKFGGAPSPTEGVWGTVKHLLQALGIPQKTSICLIPIPIDLALANVPPTS